MMLSCQKATENIDRKNIFGLNIFQRFQLWMHLQSCKFCKRYTIQSKFIDDAFHQHMHDEKGRITWEGRYRVWKEIWLLNYFGIAGNG